MEWIPWSNIIVFAEQEGTTPMTLLGLLGILATGVSGLLGVVVKWLLSHITNLTGQTMELVKSRDAVMSNLQTGFNDSLSRVVNHCEKEADRQAALQKERDDRMENLIQRQIKSTEQLKDVVAALHAKLLEGNT